MSLRGASMLAGKGPSYELLDSLVTSGMSLLLVSSEAEEVLGLAHRVLIMREGRLIAELDGWTARHQLDAGSSGLGHGPRSRTRRLSGSADPVTTGEADGLASSLNWIRDFGIVASVLALFAALSIASDAFLTWMNLVNILDQWAPVGIMACAATMVIVAAGFDCLWDRRLPSQASQRKARQRHIARAGLSRGRGRWCRTWHRQRPCDHGRRINSFVATLASALIIRGVALTLGWLSDDSRRSSFQVPRQRKGARSSSTRRDLSRVRARDRLPARADDLRPRCVRGRRKFGGGPRPSVRVNVVRAATFAFSGLSAGSQELSSRAVWRWAKPTRISESSSP